MSLVGREAGSSKRRRLAFALGGAVALPQLGFAQTKDQPQLIGMLDVGADHTRIGLMEAFRTELAARGWKEGPQVVIKRLSAAGAYDQLPMLAAGLAKKNPAVIVAVTAQSVAAAAKAAPRTPVVMAGVGDPVAYGFVKTLARPGGMITGLTNVATDTTSKYVELVVAADPRLKRVGFLIDGGGVERGRELLKDSIRRSASHHSVEAVTAEPKERAEIELSLQGLAKAGAQALACMPSPMFANERKVILRFAVMQRWPVMANALGWVRDGALLAYGANGREQFRRAAYYVDRILRGAKPADLPVELPTVFDTSVNLKAAKALGLALPPEIMVRATEVIK